MTEELKEISWPELTDKTVQGLKCCGEDYDRGECGLCPYARDCAVGIGDKLYKDALKVIEEYVAVLKLMVYQYCTSDVQPMGTYYFFNNNMIAGEHAFKLLGIENGQEVPENWI